jgi:hypothetical protein
MQEWGNVSGAPVWGGPPATPPRRRGSAWAVAGIVVAAVGFAVALIGAVLGVASLLGSGLVYAASQGEVGHGGLFRQITRIGDLFVVVPLALIAGVCTVVAWRRTRGPDRSRGATIVATVLASCLLLLSLVTALFVV